MDAREGAAFYRVPARASVLQAVRVRVLHPSSPADGDRDLDITSQFTSMHGYLLSFSDPARTHHPLHIRIPRIHRAHLAPPP
jgi:hypothetical protein